MSEIASAGDAFNKLQPVAAATYYGLGGDSSLIHSVHLKWDNAFAGVFTFELSNWPQASQPGGVDPLVAGTTGDWIPICAFSLASVVGGTIASSAATPATPASVTVVAGNPGGAVLHFATLGTYAMRCKVNCTAQGVIRGRQHGTF